ncbi:MAG: aminotransferase class V-fold PLP-dependent enzyme, partial [Thermoplasmata archaeon]
MLSEKLRADFPVLSRKIRGKNIIYLDSACMSLKPRQVIDAELDYYNNYPGCGGRSVHSISIEVSNNVDRSRKAIADFFNAEKNEIIFTKNATEGINLIAHALVFRKGDVVVTTDKEHNSNLVPWLTLAKNKKIRHVVVKSNPDNTFNLEGYTEILENENVKLVSFVHTSNLDGVTNPAKEIVRIAHKHGALVLMDAAQSAPHREIDLKEIKPDFMVCSMHKMLGPTGVGVLYVNAKNYDKLETFITGGETVAETTYTHAEFLEPPYRFEAGLQNYAGIIASASAVHYLRKIGMNKVAAHEKMLNRILTEALAKTEQVKIIG